MASEKQASESTCEPPSRPDVQDPAGYFSSYEDLSVHRLMLKDRPRTLAYRKFFENHRDLIKDKVVMDVGAGTGILSLFAASAGARKVYAVEASNIASLCKEVVEENGFEGVIEVLQGAVEDVELNVKVDVIVSEWMGFYLLHESMLDSVIAARDRFLSPGGIMAPSHATIFFAPVDLSEHFQDRADKWSNVYGFDFSPVASAMNINEVSQPLIECLDPGVIRSEPKRLLNLDLRTVTQEDVRRFTSVLEFPIAADTRVHGFACWFEVMFTATRTGNGGGDAGNTRPPHTAGVDEKADCSRSTPKDNSSSGGVPLHGKEQNVSVKTGSAEVTVNPGSNNAHALDKVSLKTGPKDPATHWKQTVIFLPQTILVGEGTELCCRVTMAQDLTANKRHYNITVGLIEGVGLDGDDDDDYDDVYVGGSGEESVGDDDDDDDEEENDARSKLLAALEERYGAEQDQLADEAQRVEVRAEVEAARQLDQDVERGGWPMDTSSHGEEVTDSDKH